MSSSFALRSLINDFSFFPIDTHCTGWQAAFMAIIDNPNDAEKTAPSEPIVGHVTPLSAPQSAIDSLGPAMSDRIKMATDRRTFPNFVLIDFRRLIITTNYSAGPTLHGILHSYWNSPEKNASLGQPFPAHLDDDDGLNFVDGWIRDRKVIAPGQVPDGAVMIRIGETGTSITDRASTNTPVHLKPPAAPSMSFLVTPERHITGSDRDWALVDVRRQIITTNVGACAEMADALGALWKWTLGPSAPGSFPLIKHSNEVYSISSDTWGFVRADHLVNRKLTADEYIVHFTSSIQSRLNQIKNSPNEPPFEPEKSKDGHPTPEHVAKLAAEWRALRIQERELKNELRILTKSCNASEEALGEAIVPKDMVPGEQIGIWIPLDGGPFAPEYVLVMVRRTANEDHKYKIIIR